MVVEVAGTGPLSSLKTPSGPRWGLRLLCWAPHGHAVWSTAEEWRGPACVRRGSLAAGLRRGTKGGGPDSEAVAANQGRGDGAAGEVEAGEGRGKGEPTGLDCGVRKISVKYDSEASRIGNWKNGVAAK